jgi:methyltransferase-like protein
MRYDRIEREQYLDFMRLRRFRQSLLTRGSSASGFNLQPSRIQGLRATVASSLLQSMAEAMGKGKTRESTLQGGSANVNAMVMWLADLAPQTVAVKEVARWYAARPQGGDRALEAVLAEAFIGGVIDLQSTQAPLTSEVAAKPRASRMARLLARTRTRIVNLRHESVNLADADARRLLTLLDGTRDRNALLRELGPGFHHGAARLDAMLQAFARLALLVP